MVGPGQVTLALQCNAAALVAGAMNDAVMMRACATSRCTVVGRRTLAKSRNLISIGLKVAYMCNLKGHKRIFELNDFYYAKCTI